MRGFAAAFEFIGAGVCCWFGFKWWFEDSELASTASVLLIFGGAALVTIGLFTAVGVQE